MIKCIILFIPGMTWTIVIKLFVRMILFNFRWFNICGCIKNTLFLWYITANSRYFPRLNFFTSPQERSAVPIPRTFDVTLHTTKPRTLVQGSEYFWCHKWLLPYLMSLLFHINSSASNEPIFLCVLSYRHFLFRCSRKYFFDKIVDLFPMITIWMIFCIFVNVWNNI